MASWKRGATRRGGRAALTMVAGASVLALSHGTALAAAADSGTNVQEVVVTASRSGAESIQKLAMAVSAVSAQQLERSNQNNLTDLMRYAPSLTITEGAPGFNTFEIRGLTAMPYRTSDTSDRSLVAVYLDDTPISVQGQTPDLKIYDLDRVEILRGPQGTLYGAGSMSGTIRFITAKPSASSFFGTAEGTVSDTEHGSVNDSFRLMVNAPLIADKLALRATLYQGEDSGYIDDIGDRHKNDVNLDRTSQARVALRWTPTDKLTVDASYTYEKSKAYGLNQGLSGLAPYTTSTNGPEGTQDDFHLYNLSWDYDLGFANLISSSSYTWRRIGFEASPDPQIGYFFQNYTGLPLSTTTYPLFNAPTSYNQAVTDLIPQENYDISNKVHDFMQEVRLVSKNDGPVHWTVGAFYEHQRRNLYQDIPVPGFDKLSYENYFYGPFNTPGGLYNSQTVDGAFEPNDIFSGLQNETEHQIALFTDDTWHVTHKLDLTAGVRYFNFKESYYLYEGGVYGVINHVPLTENASLSSNGFNPRFNASYHVNDDFMVYGEAAKGFRYGGANQPVPLGTAGVAGQCTQNLASYGYTSAPLTFGPDHLWSYSIGEKARLAGGRMTLNVDAYYVDWQDVQSRLLLNCSYFFTDNKGKIRAEGAELESTVRVTPEITLSGSTAFNDSQANGNIPTVGAFNGDFAPYSPRWTASIAAYYDTHFGDGSLHLQASYQYRSDMHTTFNPLATTIVNGQLVANGPNAGFAVIPASNDVSASIAYDIGRYEFGIFGNNLTDGVKITDIGRATYYQIYQAGDRVTYARPRTVGARIKVKF
jgi:outer membrane receptor protein involved in Fe transport